MQGIAYLMRLVNSAQDIDAVCKEFVGLTHENLHISFIAILDTATVGQIKVLYRLPNLDNIDFVSLIDIHVSEIKHLTNHLTPVRAVDVQSKSEVPIATISFIPIFNRSIISNVLVVGHAKILSKSEENLDDLLFFAEIVAVLQGLKTSSLTKSDEVQKNTIFSYRQREIAELLCKGYNVVEISKVIGFSIGTVRKDLSGIYKSLGVSSMSDARKILCYK